MTSATQQRIAGLAANGDKIKTGAWTEEEDAKLAAMQAELGNRWSEVAVHIPGRTGQQCAQRWRHKVNPNIRKEKWSEEEDRLLEELVQELGPRWADIARRCPGRTDQQCMGRWRRHLDPSVKRDAWSAQEDATLRRLHKQHGRQWALISKRMLARTAQQCRARFFQLEGPQQAYGAQSPPAKTHPCSNDSGKLKKGKSGKPPKAPPSPKPPPAGRPDRPVPSRRYTKAATRPCRPTARDVEQSDESHRTEETTRSSARRSAFTPVVAPEARTPSKRAAVGEEEEPPRTPHQPTLGASSSAPLLGADSVPLFASLSPEQSLSASLLASASPLLAHWATSPLSRLLSPQLLQDSLAPWRLSPSASLSPFGPCSFFLPPEAASTPVSSSSAAAVSLAMPRASSSPAELIRKAGEAATSRDALFSGVKRKLSMTPLECEQAVIGGHHGNGHQQGGEDEEESEEVSPGWKRLRAESDGRRESMFLSTPVQLQANLSHAGRPSLTPLATAAAKGGKATAVDAPRPKQQLSRRRSAVASSPVVASRHRLNALLHVEDLTAAF